MKFGLLFLVLISLVDTLHAGDDLYNVLGVKRTASSQDIRKAYKQLAKEWHPDKHRNNPEANERFMKINEAYETLSDDEKRQNYDNFGTTSAQQGGPQPGGGQGFDPFRQFFQGGGPFGGFTFNFGGHDSVVDKHRVGLRGFTENILPQSHTKPYLLYAYSDFCLDCIRVEHIWQQIAQDLETTGLGVGSIQVQLDHALANKLRISRIPSIVAIVNGRMHHYGGRWGLYEIRDFIRSLFPTDLIQQVTNKNYKDFLNGWSDNKVRALLFDDRTTSSLRFIAAAFAHRNRIACASINTASSGGLDAMKLYRVQPGVETLLIFKEDLGTPSATISMKQIPRSTIDEVFESNKYLMLPRLSSQDVFDELCPLSSSAARKRLCAVLLTRNTPEHDPYRLSFRKYANEHAKYQQRVQYTYVHADTQTQFVNKLTQGKGVENDTSLKLALMWRSDNEQLKFDFLENGWPLDEDELKLSRRRLVRLIDWFMDGNHLMAYTIDMPGELLDENAEGLLYRIGKRMLDWLDLSWEKIRNFDEVFVVTMFVTISFVVVLGYLMHALVSGENERVANEQAQQSSNASAQRRSSGQRSANQNKAEASRPTVYMHQLTSETFERLILKSEPGVRAIVILVDQESRSKLLQTFATVVLPYSRSEAFTFSFLQLEHYLGWYRHLLEETLDFKRDLGGINMKNCIGTVLAINGPRKYYCIFHANQERRRNSDGDFIGFDDSADEEDGDATKLFQTDLVSGFGNWMDRLCEGSLRRFRVEYWPSMTYS